MIKCTNYQMLNINYKIPNTKYQIPKTKYEISNTKYQILSYSENQVSDSDDMDAQTTSSHPESGDTVVCNDEAAAVESADGNNCKLLLFCNYSNFITFYFNFNFFFNLRWNCKSSR